MSGSSTSRPRAAHAVRATPGARLGVDIGGTRVKLGLVVDEVVVARRVVDTASLAPRAEALVDAVAEGARALVAQAASAPGSAGIHAAKRAPAPHLEAAGVGVPGVLSKGGARVLQSPNLPWLDGVELAALLSDALGVHARCDNDANCVGWGEALVGAGRGARDLVCLTLGTGVGGALILDGALVSGSRGRGAELGHLCVDPYGPACGCGGVGCLEQFASQTGLLRMLADVGLPAAGPADVQGLFAEPGRPAARAVIDTMAAALGRAVADLNQLTGVRVFVLAGGISAATPLLRPGVLRVAPGADLRQGILDTDAGILGAALLSATPPETDH